MTWRILKYLEHLFYRRYRHGHGVHSPYLFTLLNEVIFTAGDLKVPVQVRDMHSRLRKEEVLLSEGESVADFVKGSSVRMKYASLLYRISHWFKADSIIELGTGVGISTAYLASAVPETPFFSIEGNKARADFATDLMEKLGLDRVQIINGEMGSELDKILGRHKGRFLAYVDGNHYYEPTLHYVHSIMQVAGSGTVILMDDIYWSKDMYRAWREIISWQKCRISIDLFHMGILLLREDLHKQDIKLKF